MQADEDIGKVAQATPLVVSKALELFLADLLEAAAGEAQSKGAKKVAVHHIKRAILTQPNFDFLKDLVEGIPDPVDSMPVEAKPRRKRSNKTEDDSIEGETGQPANDGPMAGTSSLSFQEEEDDEEEDYDD